LSTAIATGTRAASMRTLAQRAAACGAAGEPRASEPSEKVEEKEECVALDAFDFALF
jgi:hypothetical protein